MSSKWLGRMFGELMMSGILIQMRDFQAYWNKD